MTVRNLMAGYTAYTDAQELTAMRGSHRGALVTTTDPTTTTTYLTSLLHDFPEPENAAGVSIVPTLRQVRENG
jgi:hypothetical protein